MDDLTGAGESILYWVPAATLDGDGDITGLLIHRLLRPGASVEPARGSFVAKRPK